MCVLYMKAGHMSVCVLYMIMYHACVLDLEVEVTGIGKINVDICYGGAFYALVQDEGLNVDVKQSKTTDIVCVTSDVSGL